MYRHQSPTDPVYCKGPFKRHNPFQIKTASSKKVDINASPRKQVLLDKQIVKVVVAKRGAVLRKACNVTAE